MPGVVERTIPRAHLSSWSDAGRLFALLDACDEPAVPAFCAEQPEEIALSLYKGSADEERWAIAPYLVRVEPATLDWITSDLWAEPWGVFLASDASIDELHSHFRKFLIVRSPDGEDWYFRFYDPRVLRRYLATASPADRQAFFGPVSAFAAGSGAEECVVLTPDTEGPAPVVSPPQVRRIRVR